MTSRFVQLSNGHKFLTSFNIRVVNKRSSSSDNEMTSIHTGGIDEVHLVPFEVIIRPLIPHLEEAKVESIVQTLLNPETRDQVPPIDLLWITGRGGGNYYYSFGGCHRYEAYKRLKSQFPSIPCKIVTSSIKDLSFYLGSSTPDLI